MSRNGTSNGGNGKGGSDNGSNGRLIELRQVEKTYQTAAGPFPALKNVDLTVDTGEFVAVVGKSGSGKSTLVNMVTGIDRPTAGQVLVGGTAVERLSEGKLAAWRGRTVGVIFQFFQLLPTLTVIENVMLPMDFCHMYTPKERVVRATYLLEQMDVADQAYKLPSAISGGQQQRVAIARALANDPPILAADEPTGNLDSKTADSVFRLFEELVGQGKTILMVTHDRDLAKRVTRTVIISDGEVIEERLARTFPALSEAQLIRATRDLEQLRFGPGAVIMREGEAPDCFYLVSQGHVQVLVAAPDGEEIVANTMGPGQYFGEVELLRGGANLATIRAGQKGVDLVALDREEFGKLLAESEATRQELDRTARARIEENAATRRRNGHA